MKITIERLVRSNIENVWQKWNLPEEIVRWNAASDDWQTSASEVDLTVGGGFKSRMEAKDGSEGFDLAGTYTKISAPNFIEFRLGDGRMVTISFEETAEGVMITETFEPESENGAEQQRQGWQAILDSFAAHVEAADGR